MLRRFLESSKDNENFLLVYYLERGLYNEAFQLTKSLKNATVVKIGCNPAFLVSTFIFKLGIWEVLLFLFLTF